MKIAQEAIPGFSPVAIRRKPGRIKRKTPFKKFWYYAKIRKEFFVKLISTACMGKKKQETLYLV